MTNRALPIALIVILFILIGIGYNKATPLWTPPDEELHFAYCQYIARHSSLPHFPGTSSIDKVSLAFHPPLYYLLGSLFCGANDPEIQEIIITDDTPGFTRLQHPKAEKILAHKAYILRTATLLLSALTPICVYKITVLLFPNTLAIGIIAAALSAFNPQFIHIATSISNEPLVISLVTLFILILVRYVIHTVSSWEWFLGGVVSGLCLLTKTSAILLLPITIVAIILRHIKNLYQCVYDFLIFLFGSSLIAGWWYAQNWKQITAMQTGQVWFFRSEAFNTNHLVRDVLSTIKSFFGYFGNFDISIPSYYLFFYTSLFVIGLFGAYTLYITKKLSCLQCKIFMIFFIAILCESILFIQLNKKYYACMGKYLFIVIGPIAFFVAVGVWHMFPLKLKNHLSILLCVCLVIIPIDSMARTLFPFYRTPAIQLCTSQRKLSTIIPSATSVHTVTQTFTSPCSHLCGIRIIFTAPIVQSNPQDLIVSLQEDGEQNTLYVVRTNANKIKNAFYYYFTFPPIKESLGKRYALSICFSNPHQATEIFPWRSDSNVYSDGTMIIDGLMQQEDLYFDLYFFIGAVPELQWEGVSADLIEQGPYVTVRELQFYDACNNTLRTKKNLHEKILAIWNLTLKTP